MDGGNEHALDDLCNSLSALAGGIGKLSRDRSLYPHLVGVSASGVAYPIDRWQAHCGVGGHPSCDSEIESRGAKVIQKCRKGEVCL